MSRTDGQACGIAYFARTLHERLEARGVNGFVVREPDSGPRAAGDVVLVHHHWDLFADDEVRAACRAGGAPVVLFAHEPGAEAFTEAAGLATMTPGAPPAASVPVFTAMHPAWLPPALCDRGALRRALGLPPDRLVVGTSGFLRFERQLPELVRSLAPVAAAEGWFVELVTTPWKEPSPGLVEELSELAAEHRAVFRFNTEILDAASLNHRLQACDLLWSWTATPSRPYASGALADQYASGTRVFAASKQQCEPVLWLPNAVRGPDGMPEFADALREEARRLAAWRAQHGDTPRHDPSPVSWGRFLDGFAPFLGRVAAGG